jgi:hypothetical protein
MSVCAFASAGTLPGDAPPRPVIRVSPAASAAMYTPGAPTLAPPAAPIPFAKSAPGKTSPELTAFRDVVSRARASGAAVDGLLFNSETLRVRRDTAVQVYVTATAWDDRRRAELEALGFEYETSALMPEILIQGWLKPEAFDGVAGLDWVRYIRAPAYPIVNAGSVTVQSDTIMRSANVRSTLSVNGAGVRVGVISDSADQRSEAQAKGDLPADSSIFLGKVNTGSDEGTAMMEIVYDMAPGALLGFYGPDTSVDMANGITALRGGGCQVIVDDLTFWDQPWFEEGVIETSISSNAAAGVTYATSAGNLADRVHATAYSGISANVLGVTGVNVHNFGNLVNGVPQYLMPVLFPAQTATRIMLQYDSKWGNPTDDYDLYVTDIAAQTLYGKSDTTQGTGTGQNPYPKEEVQITNNGTSDTWAFVFVNRYSGVARNMKLLVLNGTLDSRYQTKSGSILGNNKAKDALVVGAIDASEPGNDLIEYFSSQGPSIVTWPTPVTWNKPDITGIDGVFVSGAGGFGQPVSGQTYKVFYGTSAAAPTVAAVAALVLSSKNTLTPAQIKTAVTGTALERGAAGYDTVYGYGLADALAAVNSVKPPSSPGDINKDGTFNIADVSLLLRILSGLNTFPN